MERPEFQLDEMIRKAEAAKVKIFATPGKQNFTNIYNFNQGGVNQGEPNQLLSPSALVDERYFLVGAHLDEQLVLKIGKGDYVDFSKLFPRDRVVAEEDSRMELVVHNGKTFWVPMVSSVNINSFSKWEQAFRVFSNIYCKFNPHRAAELIEYNHVIHTIAMSYTWDNMYTYDREFRLHMARNPQRSWAMIQQQAWALRLRDRLNNSQIMFGSSSNANGSPSGSAGGNNRGNRTKINEPCRRFNRGRCNFGANCKFEHRCSVCWKLGHPAVKCRRLAQEKQGNKDDQQYASPSTLKQGGVNHGHKKS